MTTNFYLATDVEGNLDSPVIDTKRVLYFGLLDALTAFEMESENIQKCAIDNSADKIITAPINKYSKYGFFSFFIDYCYSFFLHCLIFPMQ